VDLNPDWEFRVWTDKENRDLVKDHYPHLLKLYDTYDVNIKRIDMVRYLYLHKVGGVYIDLDFACLAPFGDLFEGKEKFLVASQFPDRIDYANAFMASPPSHWILEKLMDNLEANKKKQVLAATGPSFLSGILKSSDPEGWEKLPMRRIYFQSWREHLCNSLENCKKINSKKTWNGILVSFWTATWDKKRGKSKAMNNE